MVRRLLVAVAAVVLVLVCAGSAAAAASRWVKLSPDSSPPAADFDLMAYDAATKQLVLFDSRVGGTWIWDGATWVRQSPITHPAPRGAGVMAYDPASQRLILFGGNMNGTRLGDTWSWDGSNWTLLQPDTAAPPGQNQAMAYDPRTSLLMLFGGFGDVSPTNDLWFWTTRWFSVAPAASPRARASASLAFDPATSQMLLFGGWEHPTEFSIFSDGDTWSWDAQAFSWRWLHPAVVPPSRAWAGMAYDAATRQLVLQGGGMLVNGGGDIKYLNDTWNWNGTTWVPLSPATSVTPARRNSAMAYDPGTRQLVLFGGQSADGNVLGDTWVWTPLAVQTRTLPHGAVGVPYSQSLQAISGTGPYTWSVATGSLPAGLQLSADGVISGTPTAAGTQTFTVKAVDAATASVARTLTLAVNPAPRPGVWAGENSAVKAFALTGAGDVPPTSTLSGALTGLNGVGGLAFDEVGDLYVTNSQGPSVEEFVAGSAGNAAPLRTIAGSSTGLAVPYGVAVDAAGQVYVADEAASAIRVYAAGARGDAAPVRTISGPHTGLVAPWGVTIVGDRLWVANYGASSLTEYPLTADGDVAPTQTIAGAATGLNGPQGLGQDASGNLLVANFFGRSILSFASAGPFGNVAPKATIGGASSQLSLPQAVDVDTADRLFVADENAGVLVFTDAGATTPAAVMAGANVGGPSSIAVAPPLDIASTRLPRAALGRRYSQRLLAILGRAPMRWRLIFGRLPRGLHLARSGRVTGTPRRTGRFHFAVQASDAERTAQTARARITLVIARAPAVTSVRPASGTRHGGRSVRILGSGFSRRRGATTIEFGRLRAARVRCSSRRRCTAVTPPHPPGMARVTVTVAGLSSRGSRGARYRFKHGQK